MEGNRMKVINTAYLALLLTCMGSKSLVDASDLRYKIDALTQQAYALIQAIPLPDGQEHEEKSYEFEQEEESSEEVIADSIKPSFYSTLNAIKQLSQNTHYRLYGQQAINQLTALELNK